MYRQTADRLCKLCPKGEFADDFGAPYCASCPRHHTTRGLGSRADSQCYYSRHHHSNSNSSSNSGRSRNNGRGRDNAPAAAVRSDLTVVPGPRATVTPKTSLKKGRLGFVYYNMWNRRKSDGRSAKDKGLS